MKNPFTALFRARDKPKDAVSAAPTFYFGTSGSGKAVNANTAIQLSTVYACVRVISETVASLPLGVYEATDAGNRKATDHSLYRLLHDEPNSEMTSFILREVMLGHLLLWGNSYCQIIRTGRNKVTGLYPLLPDKMTVDRDKNGVLTYTYSTTSGQTVVLPPEDVLHIPGLGFDGVMGYSPVALEKNVVSCTRYYLLQLSTLSPPAKPTTKPPTGSWNDTEPTYTSGSTNSLYFCDLTVFSDGTWSYSSVSRSSSYEAAKEAYNRAIAAGQSASDALTAAQQAAASVDVLQDKVISKGIQLITNGTGMLGDNTNFESWTYDPTNAHLGSNGSFMRSATGNGIAAAEYIALTGGVDYLFEFDMKSLNGLATCYSALIFYDADKQRISPAQIMFRPNTLTTLTQDLKPGDTVVHLADLSNWDVNTGTMTYRRAFLFWNYTNSFGYTYPPETYSRNRYGNLWTDANLNKTNNTITLTKAWTGDTYPAGTQVSQGDSGGTYRLQRSRPASIPAAMLSHLWAKVTGPRVGTTYASGNTTAIISTPTTRRHRNGRNRRLQISIRSVRRSFVFGNNGGILP